MGWSNSVAVEVGDHRSAEDDAEAVGAIGHHSASGDGLFEGLVGGDDDFGFGVDDVVGHCGGCRMILRKVGWGGQS